MKFVGASRLGSRSIAVALLGAQAAWLGGIGSALAQKPTVGALNSEAPLSVVELFTSQGCSSCPPADALLGKYARRPDVIALSLAVDYWDYLGWKDTLASPACTRRQKEYAHGRGDGMIYTPQVVINGRLHVNGADAAKIDKAIARTAPELKRSALGLALAVEGDRLAITTSGTGKAATLWLMVAESSVTVPIRSGENRGAKITYTNIVRHIEPVAAWTGQPGKLLIAKPEALSQANRFAVLLAQRGNGGPLLAAASLAQR